VEGLEKSAKVLNYDQDANYKLQNTTRVLLLRRNDSGNFSFKVFKTWPKAFLSVCGMKEKMAAS
jgi:hypothetical protein